METNDFVPYLIWFVNLLYRAALQSTIRANNVRIAMNEMKQKIRSLDSNMYSQDLVNTLFLGPIVFTEKLVVHDVAGSISTAHSYLKKLLSANLLQRSTRKYNRRVGYINTKLLEALRGDIAMF